MVNITVLKKNFFSYNKKNAKQKNERTQQRTGTQTQKNKHPLLIWAFWIHILSPNKLPHT